MKKNIILTAGLVAAVMLALATPSFGQFGLSFEKRGRRSNFGVNIGFNSRRACHVHQSCCIRTTPGHWKTVCQRVWVPGCARRVWVRPVYRINCGRRVLVRRGYWRTIPGRGHWKTVNRRVWVPGSRRYVCGF